MLRPEDIDFETANHRQRQAVRGALRAMFPAEIRLRMYLDDAFGWSLDDFIDTGQSYPERIYDLVINLRAQGRLNRLMQSLSQGAYRAAPALHDLCATWSSLGDQAPATPQDIAPPPAAASPRAQAQPTAPDAGATIERILEDRVVGWRPMSWIEDLARLRASVCLLRGKRQSRATGVLVGPRHVLTAAYVVMYESVLAAVFDYETEESPGRSVAVKGVLYQDPPAPAPGAAMPSVYGHLDIAVLELSAPAKGLAWAGTGVRPWQGLGDARQRLRVGEPLVMLHHPEGLGMRLSEGSVREGGTDPRRFRHSCPTTGGSGGAPVFDTKLRLVGLHEGKIPAQGGTALNQAIRASQMGAALAEAGVDLGAQWAPA